MADAGRGAVRARMRAVVLAAALLGRAFDAEAQPPEVVPRLDAARLAGDWYEIATAGAGWHRHCRADTRYRFDQPAGDSLRATSVCATARGRELHRGRLRAGGAGDGRLAIRFSARLFSWLAATWSDFWILDAGDDTAWLLIGDNRRERLFVISRTVALDEAAMARALATARRQGYAIEGLALVPHPSGAAGLPMPR